MLAVEEFVYLMDGPLLLNSNACMHAAEESSDTVILSVLHACHLSPSAPHVLALKWKNYDKIERYQGQLHCSFLFEWIAVCCWRQIEIRKMVPLPPQPPRPPTYGGK
ncbi:hypothetical protein V6N13_144880 [Hibiscus sabdariffa]|uniref:Uncharacterized protein n=1 Tax=Hibiscus sabdariffa TaxID=183260 RepID=A0ABR2FLZ0_9ROSI